MAAQKRTVYDGAWASDEDHALFSGLRAAKPYLQAVEQFLNRKPKG